MIFLNIIKNYIIINKNLYNFIKFSGKNLKYQKKNSPDVAFLIGCFILNNLILEYKRMIYLLEYFVLKIRTKDSIL